MTVSRLEAKPVPASDGVGGQQLSQEKPSIQGVARCGRCAARQRGPSVSRGQ